MNVNALVVLPSSELEISKLAEERTPASCSKRDMMRMVKYATNKPYSFLFINLKAPSSEQLRSGFKKIISC